MLKAALAGLVVLIIGDSHNAQKDFLLGSLHEALVNQGAAVHSYGVCGSQPFDWVKQTELPCGRAERHNLDEPVIETAPKVKTWSLESLIQKHHPGLLVVELGDNMGGYGITPALPKEWIAFEVQEMLKPIAAKKLPCVWVGPPWGSEGGASNKTFARVHDLSDYLSQLVYPCHYVDSLRFSQPGQWATFDGEHLTPDSYRIWGADIADATVRLSAKIRAH
ncbi:MAG: SGNH/GDSL hydrolase family protein [Alphaproteobacteria bacterium]|nr:SGNH/GDSL hydrolase family protein [Alphaproteobacteria bacterium]MBV9552996.1 SGNH/GDSL hydrolase family protein [Alphaproteobacteria bacterium]